MKVLAVLCVLSATLASAYTPKARLLSKFQQPTADAVLACPTTKGPLSTERKYIGSVVRTCKVNADGVRYPANEVRLPSPFMYVSPWGTWRAESTHTQNRSFTGGKERDVWVPPRREAAAHGAERKTEVPLRR